MTRWLLWLLFPAALAAAAAAWKLPARPGKRPGLAVEARRGDYTLVVEAPGLVTAEVEQDVIVPQELQGPIIAMLAEQGTEVKKGDLVASLSTFQAQRDDLAARTAVAEKKAELSRQEREDAVKVAELADVLRQKQARLEAARALLALAEKGPDPLQVEKLELKLDSSGSELADLQRKSGIQDALRERGYASGLKAREASDAASRKRLEIAKDQNLLAKEREGATVQDRQKLRLAVGSLEREVALATKDKTEQTAVLALEREKKKLEIQSKEEVVAQKQRALASARLLAPIDGTLVHKTSFFNDQPYEVGSSVWGGVVLASVVRMGRPRALVRVGERAIDRVMEGQAALLRVSAEPGTVRKGKVLTVSRVSRPRDANDASGAKDFEVTVAFEDEARHLKVNLPVKATIETSRLRAAWRVPKEAVFEDAKTRALSVHPLGALVPAAVTAGDEDQDWYYLKDGVTDGEQLACE
ncbi:MAG: HlyD family efflux transporter periplasmic adaptor subunit [Candidatus Wallbacteria bacterium]|nr:HlyD family efflux transporter periplasmic adaptor subunit [Candidatus Wallbacteria bacterium]